MSANTATKTAKSPRNGAEIPLGAHPANSGGRKGRSGRKPDEFKAKLADVRDVHSLHTLEEIMSGVVTYTLHGTCEHCGKESTGPNKFSDVLSLVPSVDSRLRAADLTMKYTIGTEKTVRLEGPFDVRRAFDVIKGVLRRLLEPERAEDVIRTIQDELLHL